MSPVNIFRPKGFSGGYDQRFIKPLQPGTGGTPVDPLANVKELHAVGVTLKPHAHAASRSIKPHATAEAAWIVQHAYGFNLEVYVV